ncbi:MAG: ThiF family adenylyltransferase [Acutalibacteraceae bacterium]
MIHEFSRSELLFGPGAMQKLRDARVAVFGIGGVGGYVVEALARGGVGTLDLIDHDQVSLTNLNRQIIATRQNMGMEKVDAAEERIHAICPETTVHKCPVFFLPETRSQFDFSAYDYVVDAIDTVSGKIGLIEACSQVGTPILSAMGAGNKMDPTAFQVMDLAKTQGDPLARVMRRELRRRGIRHVKVVCSTEQPIEPLPAEENTGRRVTPGSTSFVPPVVGLIIAGEVIKDLSGYNECQSRGENWESFRQTL